MTVVVSAQELVAEFEAPAYSRNRPVNDVVRLLLDWLGSGRVVPGARLPSERTLAQTLDVGRSAVREGLAALEVLGVVVARAGSGNYFRDGSLELEPLALSWGHVLSPEHTAQLVEVRAALEVQATVLAAERRTADDVAALEAHVTTMAASLEDLTGFVVADAAFHRRLLEAAGNHVLADVLASTRSLLRLWFDRGVAHRDPARLAVEEHRAVLVAVRAGDPAAAAAAMRTHMHSAGDRILRTDRAEPPVPGNE